MATTAIASQSATQLPTSLLVVLDVDGVTRHDIKSKADPAVTDIVRGIIADEKEGTPIGLRVAFVSGSHSHNMGDIEDWRRGNLSLSEAFSGTFSADEFSSGHVRVVGQLGSDTCDPVVVAEQPTPAPPLLPITSCRDAKEDAPPLVDLRGRQVASLSDSTRLSLLRVVLTRLGGLLLESGNLTPEEHAGQYCGLLEEGLAQSAAAPLPEDRAPDALEPLAAFVRSTCDANFRLICHGACAEVGTRPQRRPLSAIRESSLAFYRGLIEDLEAHEDPAVSALSRNVATGVGVEQGEEFMWCIVTLSTKEDACGAMIEEEVSRGSTREGLTVLTVGDSTVDYPMHRLANAAFHVGPISTWRTMREDAPDRDKHQHVVHVVPAFNTGKRGSEEAEGEEGAGAPPAIIDMALVDGTVSVLTLLRSALRDVRSVVGGGGDVPSAVRSSVVAIADLLRADGAERGRFE